MNTNKQFIVIIVLTLTVIGVILFVYLKRRNADEESTDSQTASDSGTAMSGASAVSSQSNSSSHESWYERAIRLFGSAGSTTSDSAAQAITNASYPLQYAPSVYSSLVKEAQGTLNKVLIKYAAAGKQLPVYNGSTLKSLVEDGYYGPRMAAVVAYLSGGSTDGHKLGTTAMAYLKIYAA